MKGGKKMIEVTTEDILWNAAFEEDTPADDSYNYDEEKEIEKYYDKKDNLYERLSDYFRPSNL